MTTEKDHNREWGLIYQKSKPLTRNETPPTNQPTTELRTALSPQNERPLDGALTEFIFKCVT